MQLSVFAAVIMAGCAHAELAPHTLYAQTLADQLVHDHPLVIRCALYVSAPDASVSNTYIIADSDPAMVGLHCGPEEFAVLTTGTPVFRRIRDQALFEGKVPLFDRQSEQIGLVLLSCRYTTAEEEPRWVNLINAVRNELKLKIPNRAELFRTNHPVPTILAQLLVNRIKASHPELIRCGIHAIPPGGRMVDSINIAYADELPLVRVGGRSDHDEDYGVLTTGKPLVYFWDKTPFNAKAMFKAALPLLDRHGFQIGVLVLGYTFSGSETATEVEKKATALRDGLKVYLCDHAALFSEARLMERIQAQALVEEVVARNAAVAGATIHAAAPGAPIANAFAIAGSNRGEVGVPSGEAEFEVMTTGEPMFFGLDGGQVRRGILPLYDVSERLVGSLTLVIRPDAAATDTMVNRQMAEIRDRLKVRIRGVDDLFSDADAP